MISINRKFINIITVVIIVATDKKFSPLQISANENNYNNTLLRDINNAEGGERKAISTRKVLWDDTFENKDFPADCSQREKTRIQPTNNENSRLQKCCPIGESLSIFKENQSEQLCDTSSVQFKPNIINAILYDNCIEDIETELSLPFEIGNPCNTSLLYNSMDDIFYVLQDGSLLIMDEFANQSYTVEKKYCLDIDNVSGTTYAIICITSVEEHLQRGQTLIVAVLMLISIPCLGVVCYVHLTVKALRTLHGISLSIMSMCLIIGYFFLSLVHISHFESSGIGYTVQFFMLSYFFWFLCICINVCLNIWYKIPFNKRHNKIFNFGNFMVYFLISFLGPLCLVIATVQKGLPGMPSYFIRGFTESIRDSQRYFIPPVTTILILSFAAMVFSFFGFQKMKKSAPEQKGSNCNVYSNINVDFDKEKYEEVKKDAKCISLLGIILITTWLLEIVTFYSPGPEGYLIILEMINGLQGAFIMLIFVVVRRRRTIILRWWFDRGSHKIDNIELASINN